MVKATAFLEEEKQLDPFFTLSLPSGYRPSIYDSLRHKNLIGSFGPDKIFGGSNADKIEGREGDDILNGGAGNDTLLGGSGDDYLLGGRGDDRFNGERGIDTVSYTDLSHKQDSVTLVFQSDGSGYGIVTRASSHRSSRTELDRFSSIEVFVGGRGTDGLDFAHLSARTIVTATLGDSGSATHFSLILEDKIINESCFSFENVTGGYGDDILTGNKAANLLNGGSGNDILRGNGGKDHLEGGGGDDVIYAKLGDIINGGAGNDTLILEDAGTLRIDLSSGKVYDAPSGRLLLTATGIENWQAGTGTTIAFSFPFASGRFFYGSGASEIFSGSGKGSDTVSYERDNTGQGVQIYLDTGNGYVMSGGFAQGDKLISVENIIGSNANDILVGDQKKNLLVGGKGDDLITVYGNDQGQFDDVIDGGEGNLDRVSFAGYANDAGKGALRENQTGIYVDLNQGKAWDSFTTHTGILAVTDLAQVDINSLAASYATLKGIEVVSGTSDADILVGDDRNNTFIGSLGDDYIDGESGQDTVILNNALAVDKITVIANPDASFDTDIHYGNSIFTQDHDHLVNIDIFDAGEDGKNNWIDLSHIGSDFHTFLGLDDTWLWISATGSSNWSSLTELHGFDNAMGSQGADGIFGNAKDNHISGKDGDDEIWGEGGKDILDGGAGDDWLDGGQNIDEIDLTGSGKDVVVINSLLDAGDILTGFSTSGTERDRLDLSSLFDFSAPDSNVDERAAMLEMHQTATGADLLLHQADNNLAILIAQFQGITQQDITNIQSDLAQHTQNIIRLAFE